MSGDNDELRPDEQNVPEQSEPMPLSDDMVDPHYDVAGVALSAVSSEEAAEVRAAAATDAALAAELASMREVVAELSRIEPLEMINRGRSAGIRSRLIARAAASRPGRGAGSPALAMNSAATSQQKSGASAPAQHRGAEQRNDTRNDTQHAPRNEILQQPRVTSGPRGRSWGWLALAASIAFAAAATQLWRVSNQRGDVAAALASRQTTLAEQVSQLTATVAARDSVIAALTGTSTRVIDLASYSSLAPMGRVFWDQKSEQWTMYAKHLKQPAAGNTYQLWLIAKGDPAPISAGTFTPDPAGSAVVHAKYALAPGTLDRIAVTEEPDGGVAAPTGPVLFVGVGK